MGRLWRAIATNEGNVSCCDHTHRGRLDPQLGLGRFSRQHPRLVAFDHRQDLVANIVNFEADEWAAHYDVAAERGGARGARMQVRNRHTGVRPCFLHVPGLYGKKRARQVGVYQKVAASIVPRET